MHKDPCPVSTAERRYDGGGTLSDSELSSQSDLAIQKQSVADSIFEVLTDISPADVRRLVWMLFRADGKHDFCEAGRLLYTLARSRVDAIIVDELQDNAEDYE